MSDFKRPLPRDPAWRDRIPLLGMGWLGVLAVVLLLAVGGFLGEVGVLGVVLPCVPLFVFPLLALRLEWRPGQNTRIKTLLVLNLLGGLALVPLYLVVFFIHAAGSHGAWAIPLGLVLLLDLCLRVALLPYLYSLRDF